MIFPPLCTSVLALPEWLYIFVRSIASLYIWTSSTSPLLILIILVNIYYIVLRDQLYSLLHLQPPLSPLLCIPIIANWKSLKYRYTQCCDFSAYSDVRNCVTEMMFLFLCILLLYGFPAVYSQILFLCPLKSSFPSNFSDFVYLPLN